MDAIHLESDLHALKRLYGLLRNDENGGTETVSELLDEHARHLLKNMLDAKAKKVLKVHSEMFAGQVEALGTSPPTKQLMKDYSTEVGRSCGKDKDSGRVTNVGRLDINLSKDGRLTPQWSREQEHVVEQSAETLVANGRGPDSVERRCRLCQRNTVKKLESMEEEEFYDAAQDPIRFISQQNNESESESERYPWNRKMENEMISNIDADEPTMKRGLHNKPVLRDVVPQSRRKIEEVDLLCEEASKAIEQIEICISALPTADHLQMLEEDSARQRNYVPENKPSQTAEMSQSMERFIGNNSLSGKRAAHRVGYPLHQLPNLTTEEINQLYFSKLVRPTKAVLRESRDNCVGLGGSVSGGEPLGDLRELLEEGRFPPVTGFNIKTIIDNIEPGNWLKSYNDSQISRFDDAHDFSPALNPHEASYKYPCCPAAVPSASQFQSTYQSHAPVKDQISTCRLSKKGTRSKNQSQVQQKHNPNKRHMPITTRTSFEQQESECSATESYSSEWTSQQTSSYGSDAYSWTDQSRDLEFVSSSMTSQSGFASPLSHTTRSQYSSYSSNSKDEPYSSASGDNAYAGTSGLGNKSVGGAASTSKKLGPRRTRKYNGIKHKKQGGTWNRLKDKLAIIFHHHHHHHHHKRNDHDIGHRKLMGRKTSLHKQRKRQGDEANGERAVEKMTRSLVLDKNQHSHFRGLMEGLMRHVWSSKPSKPGRETMPQFTNGRRRRYKTLNKSHWWQLMQHQRGAKFGNKKTSSLDWVQRKTRLKALPSLK